MVSEEDSLLELKPLPFGLLRMVARFWSNSVGGKEAWFRISSSSQPFGLLYTVSRRLGFLSSNTVPLLLVQGANDDGTLCSASDPDKNPVQLDRCRFPKPLLWIGIAFRSRFVVLSPDG